MGRADMSETNHGVLADRSAWEVPPELDNDIL